MLRAKVGQAGKIWCILHHGLSKIRKGQSYDCIAEFGEISLNKQLMVGPDKMNHLVGVLARFKFRED